MYVKDECLVCGNDDYKLIHLTETGEQCDICGCTAIKNEVIEDETEDIDASYKRLF